MVSKLITYLSMLFCAIAIGLMAGAGAFSRDGDAIDISGVEDTAVSEIASAETEEDATPSLPIFADGDPRGAAVTILVDIITRLGEIHDRQGDFTFASTELLEMEGVIPSGARNPWGGPMAIVGYEDEFDLQMQHIPADQCQGVAAALRLVPGVKVAECIEPTTLMATAS